MYNCIQCDFQLEFFNKQIESRFLIKYLPWGLFYEKQFSRDVMGNVKKDENELLNAFYDSNLILLGYLLNI